MSLNDWQKAGWLTEHRTSKQEIADLLAFLSLVAGLVLDTVTRGRREAKLIAYLQQRAPGEDWDRRT